MAIEDVAVIGVAVETTGIERGKKSLDDLAASGVKVDSAMAKVGASTTGASTGANTLGAAAGKTGEALNKQASSAEKAALEMRKVEVASNAAAQAQKRAGESTGGVVASFVALKSTVGVLAIASAAKQFFELADAASNVRARLSLVTSSAAELVIVQGRLFDIAQASRVGFEGLANTYTQIARATKELGISQQALLSVTETISQAITISGASATSANAALIQLSQGLAAGQLRGEELNSVLEQTPRLAQAIADGLGITTGELRAFAQAGQLTADTVLTALQKSAAGVADEFAKIPPTVDQASTVLKNALGAAVGEFDNATRASAGFAKGIIALSGAIKDLSGFLAENRSSVRLFAESIPQVGLLVRGVRALSDEQDNSAESIKKQIAQLEALNRIGPSIYNRSEESLAKYGESIRQRTDEIDKLKAKLQSINAVESVKGLDTRAEDARLADGLERKARATREAAADTARLAEIRQQLSGVDKNYLSTLSDLYSQYQKGNLAESEYIGLVERLIDKNTKKSQSSNLSARSLKAEQSAYRDLISRIGEKIEAEKLEILGGSRLSDSQRLRVKLEQDLLTGKLKLSAASEAAVRAGLDELSTLEQQSQGIAEAGKAAENAADAYQKYISSLSKDNAGIRDQINQLEEQTQRLGLTELAVARLDAAKIEMLATDAEARANGLEENAQNEETIRLLQEQAQAYRDLATAKLSNAGRRETLRIQDESEKAAQKANEDWEKASQKINDSLTDALLRGFESGKDFAKNLRDTVINMFKTMILRPVISAIIKPIGGALAGALGFSGAAQAATGAGGVGGLAGLANIGSTISQSLNLLNNGISNTIGAAFSRFATSGIGQSLGLGTAPIIGNNPSAFVPSQVTPLGSSVGQFLGTAGGFLAGRGLGQAISGGYAVSGSGNGIVNAGSAIGGLLGTFGTAIGGIFSSIGSLGGPLGAIIGGVVGGLVNRLFGRKLADVGVEGTLGGESGFSGRQFEFFRGGLFRSDKTVYSELDADFERGIANIFKSLRAQTAFFADALGLDAQRIADFTSEIKISTKGLEPQEIQARFQEAIANANNELAEQLIGSYEEVVTETTRRIQERVGDPDNYDIVFRDVIDKEVTRTYKPSEFAREGEQAIDTLTRLATSLLTVNGIFESLGQTLLESSLAGGDIASQLADLFGGLENFTNAASGYLSAYYTGEEQRALALAQIGRRLGEVGLTTPTNKEDLRRQLEAQDLTTEAGRRAYAALLEVAAAFAQVEDSAQQAADAARQAYNDRLSAAFRALERATDKERQIIQARIDVAQESADALQGVFDAIVDGVKGLREDALGAVVTGQAGQDFITNALANAQSTGYLPDAGELSQAISDARAGLNERQFVSESDRRFEQLRLAGELAALGDLTGEQLTEAQRLLRSNELQLEALDKQLDYWREQVEIAQGTFEAVLSVADAIEALAAALALPDTTANTRPTTTEPASPFVIGGGNTEPSGNVVRSAGRDASGRYIKEQYYGGYGSGFTVVNDEEQARLEALQRVYEEASNTAENIADAFRILFDAGASLTDIGALTGFNYIDLLDAARRAGVNSYAVGTNYVPKDQLAFVHEGEAIVPKAFNPAANPAIYSQNDTMQANAFSAMATEIKAMRLQIDEMNRQATRTANAVNGQPEAPMLVETVA